MGPDQFNDIVLSRMEHCHKTLIPKGEEYSRNGDRLWNFKRAGEKRHCSPSKALQGMAVKHDVSIDDIIDDLDKGIIPSKEMVAEKFGDAHNYLYLQEALIEEAREKHRGKPVQQPHEVKQGSPFGKLIILLNDTE